MCKVSVIIPVYRVKRDFLNECIESLRRQSLEDLEFIFVDDCGNDGSIQYIKEVFLGDTRAKIIHNEGNAGAGYSRNRGIEAAKGEYIGFMDSDDFIDEDFYKRLYYTAKYYDSDIVKGIRKNTSTQEMSWLSKQMHNIEFTSEESIEWFNHEHVTAIFNREMIVKNHVTYGRTRISEDVTFLLKANYYAKKVNVCTEAVYYYRDYIEGSLTSSSFDRNITEYLEAIKERIDFLNTNKEIPEKSLKKLMGDYIKTLESWKRKYIDFYFGINVSVVIPMYNCEEYLDSLFECLCNQSLKNIEIICIDDGSTDETASVIHKYQESDKRISYYYQENMGAGVARNLGISKAKGAYIIFLDADDMYDVSLLERMFNVAEEHSADVVNCLFRQVDYWKKETVENLGYRMDLIPNKIAFSPKEVENLLTAFTQGPINKLFRRQFINEKNLTFSSTKIANDIKFTTLALIEANKIACIRENLLTVRRYINNNSISSNRAKYLEHSIIAYRELYDSIVKYGKIKIYEKQLCSTVGDTIYYNGQYGRNEKFINEIKKWLKQAPWKDFDKKTVRNLLHLGALKEKKVTLENLKRELLHASEENQKGLEIKIFFAENQIANVEEIEDFVEATFKTKSFQGTATIKTDTPQVRISKEQTKTPFIIRKLSGGIQCCKDHGILYTIKYAFIKIAKKCTG